MLVVLQSHGGCKADVLPLFIETFLTISVRPIIWKCTWPTFTKFAVLELGCSAVDCLRLHCFAVRVWKWNGNRNHTLGIPQIREWDLSLEMGMGRNENWLDGNGNVEIHSQSSPACSHVGRMPLTSVAGVAAAVCIKWPESRLSAVCLQDSVEIAAPRAISDSYSRRRLRDVSYTSFDVRKDDSYTGRGGVSAEEGRRRCRDLAKMPNSRRFESLR